MTDRTQTANELKAVLNLPGWRHILRIFHEEEEQGWHDFIDLPVDKKTSKASFDAQARYKAPGRILERIQDEIRTGEMDERGVQK